MLKLYLNVERSYNFWGPRKEKNREERRELNRKGERHRRFQRASMFNKKNRDIYIIYFSINKTIRFWEKYRQTRTTDLQYSKAYKYRFFKTRN